VVEQRLLHFDCDRCGQGWTGTPDDQPDGWFGLTFIRPLLAAFEEPRVHLCDWCARDLSRFLNNKEVPSRE
jgi:hypothetical protein